MFNKKIIKIVTILSLCLCIFCSCGVNINITSLINDIFTPSEYDPSDVFSDDHSFAKETMMTVLKCFDENDKETLKNLFSKSKVNSVNDLDEQIEEAMKCYEGKSVSHDDIENEISDSGKKDKHYYYKSIRAIMENIITDDSDKVYRVEFSYVIVNEDDETTIGLSLLKLYDETDPKDWIRLAVVG